MPACVAGAARARARVPGADRRRRDQPRLRPPHALPARARSPTRSTSPASSTARTPSQGLDTMDALVDEEARDGAGRARSAPRRSELREKPVVRRRRAADHRRPACARRRAPTSPIPTPPFWGVREIEVDLDEVFPYLDRHVLFKLHWGGRGMKGEAWRRIVEGTTRRRASRRASSGCGASRTTCTRARGSATSPATPTATSCRLRPRGPRARARAARLPAPAQARPDLPGRLLPPAATPASATWSRCRA